MSENPKRVLNHPYRRPKGLRPGSRDLRAGNVSKERLQPALKKAIDDELVVVNVTQCLKGTVNLELYAAGSWMQEIGVTSGIDMIPEAAVTKLHWLLRKYPLREQADKIRRAIPKDLRGELTEPGGL